MELEKKFFFSKITFIAIKVKAINVDLEKLIHTYFVHYRINIIIPLMF